MDIVDAGQGNRSSGDARRHPARVQADGMLLYGRSLPRSSAMVVGASVFVVLGALWWIVSATQMVSPLFLPAPSDVITRFVELAYNGTLLADIHASLYRISIAFLAASVIAIPIGIVGGCYGFWRAAIEPLMEFIRYMPVVAFVPLTILWFGTDDLQKFVVIAIGTFFQQVLMVIDVVKRVPPEFIALGRTMGLPGRKSLLRIVLPFALPGIWDMLRVSLGWAWTWLVLAELVAANSGLGYRIVVSQRYLQIDTIVSYILVLGAIGLVVDQLMRMLESVLFPYEKRDL